MSRKKWLLAVAAFILLAILLLVWKATIGNQKKQMAEPPQAAVETDFSVPDPEEEMPVVDPSPARQAEANGQPSPFSDEKLLACADDVSYGVYYFDDDSYYSRGISQKMPSASVIKVFIMDFVYSGANAGAIDLKKEINGYSIEKLVRDMIQKSDNAATNTLIDRFGMDTINAHIRKNGYVDTVLSRKMLDENARRKGLENYTSVDDVMLFLKNMYHKQETQPYHAMLEIMKGQTVKTKLPLFLPDQTVVANKTGELEDVENDIGIIFTGRSALAMAVLTNHTRSAQQTRTEIGRLAKSAYELLNGKEQ